jgi:hypothetical protein
MLCAVAHTGTLNVSDGHSHAERGNADLSIFVCDPLAEWALMSYLCLMQHAHLEPLLAILQSWMDCAAVFPNYHKRLGSLDRATEKETIR